MAGFPRVSANHGTSSCRKIKHLSQCSGWEGSPAWEIGSQEPVKTLGTTPAPIAGSPTYRPSYTTITFMKRAMVSPMKASWLLVQTLWVPMNLTSGFCGISRPCWLLQSLFSLLIRTPGAQLDVWHGSLNLSPSVIGWRPSKDNWDSHKSYYRKWPVEVMHPLLPGVLTGACL